MYDDMFSKTLYETKECINQLENYFAKLEEQGKPLPSDKKQLFDGAREEIRTLTKELKSLKDEVVELNKKYGH